MPSWHSQMSSSASSSLDLKPWRGVVHVSWSWEEVLSKLAAMAVMAAVTLAVSRVLTWVLILQTLIHGRLNLKKVQDNAHLRPPPTLEALAIVPGRMESLG